MVLEILGFFAGGQILTPKGIDPDFAMGMDPTTVGHSQSANETLAWAGRLFIIIIQY